MVVIDATGLEHVDLETVDALTRVALFARRCGREVRLAGAGPELAGLLELTGLAGILGPEALGEPEHREEARGVEEEGDAANEVPGRLHHLE